MADVAELPLTTRVFLKAYRWRRNDPVPFARPTKPLHESKIAIVSTAGLVLPAQTPFDDHIRGGDFSFREIPSNADTSSLIDTHRSETYDHRAVQSDPNLAFPIDRMHELARDRIIGAVNHRHFSLMGSITATKRLMAESAPVVADALAADGVDAVLLVPI